MKFIRSNAGISIVEVLVGFIILSVLLVSFLGVLLQTKKTNASSETIQEVTYLAQAEMENIYLIANNKDSLNSLNSNLLVVNGHNYNKKTNESDIEVLACKTVSTGQLQRSIKYESRFNGYLSNLQIDLTCYPKNNVVGRIIIELVDSNLGTSKVKVENAYTWR